MCPCCTQRSFFISFLYDIPLQSHKLLFLSDIGEYILFLFLELCQCCYKQSWVGLLSNVRMPVLVIYLRVKLGEGLQGVRRVNINRYFQFSKVLLPIHVLTHQQYIGICFFISLKTPDFFILAILAMCNCIIFWSQFAFA